MLNLVKNVLKAVASMFAIAGTIFFMGSLMSRHTLAEMLAIQALGIGVLSGTLATVFQRIK